ncbi:hypothetical protein CGCFRS4_v015817 [Colletotrichum fructicola]|nr:hypothetical protein CGCFRS4_v015817 [Colletotrichum fructicola]
MLSTPDFRRAKHRLLGLLPQRASHPGSARSIAVDLTTNARPQSIAGVVSVPSSKKFPENPCVRPNGSRLVARQEFHVVSRESPKRSERRVQQAPTAILSPSPVYPIQALSKFHMQTNSSATDTGPPVHIAECMVQRRWAGPLDCPSLYEIAMLSDEDVAEKKDELWFTLVPMVDFWNSEADTEAKRILQNNGLDSLTVVGICISDSSNSSLSLHKLYAYSAVTRDETLVLADDTLDSIRRSSGWVTINFGLRPDGAGWGIAREFHRGSRIQRRTGATQYMGIIVIGRYLPFQKTRQFRNVDWILLYNDVETMLEFIINRPLRLYLECTASYLASNCRV